MMKELLHPLDSIILASLLPKLIQSDRRIDSHKVNTQTYTEANFAKTRKKIKEYTAEKH